MMKLYRFCSLSIHSIIYCSADPAYTRSDSFCSWGTEEVYWAT